MSKQQNVAIFGATGTIGTHTLDVISRHPDRFRAYALAANSNVDVIFNQCMAHEPEYAVMLAEDAAEMLSCRLRQAGSDTKVLFGVSAMEDIASHPEVDAIMAAIVGAAGLRPAMAAAHAGKRILLANKETLVMAGSLFMRAVEEGGATLLPIDSEHNAIFQVMPAQRSASLMDGGVKRVLLTASGGPFRTWTEAQLQKVTCEEALNHPNWVMGPKITIDSATLMNKGLEVIEAHWLFNARPDQIDVVVHPQSVIHSMVEYVDGSVLAQLGNPDMRTPIAYALGYPDRLDSGVSTLDLMKIARLDFEAPDMLRFPCLMLAYEALERGGTAPAILNAANEIAVAAFLSKKITFMDIPHLIESVLSSMHIEAANTIEGVIKVDAAAREAAAEWMLVH
ncbi:MAG TPA: 1-deoxy-D-xylulose-5-phosphate reductoisomerase [Methylophilaceae bacterium]|nr:1-deoxy-D-xylulose-5-phosphate reductoisomerase [Methylophilaceae bacterium]